MAVGFAAAGLLGLVVAALQLLRADVVLLIAAAALIVGGVEVGRAVRLAVRGRRRLAMLVAPALTLGALMVAVVAPAKRPPFVMLTPLYFHW